MAKITQLTATPFRLGDARTQRSTRKKRRIAHTERLKDVLLRKLIEWHSTHALHDFAERDETDVAISETRAGRIAQRLFNEVLDRFVVTGPTFTQIEIRWIAGTMKRSS